MGSSKSGNYREGKIPTKDKARVIRELTRKRNPVSVLQMAFKYQVSPQYIYTLLKPRKTKSLDNK